MNLGCIYKDRGNLDQALASTLKSVSISPDNLNSLIQLATIYSDIGEHKKEQETLDKAKSIDPINLNLEIMASQVFKKIHMAESDIDDERRKFEEATRYIQKNPNLRFHVNLPIKFGIFWLPYHGRNDDKELIQKFCEALANNFDIKKILSKNRMRCKIKGESLPTTIGILSSFWSQNHPVNLHYSEIVKHLIETDLKVEIIAGSAISQSEQSELKRRYGTTVTRLTANFEENCKTIIGLNLDLLLYLDIGMSCDTYLLGLARLAPVQMVMGGHPCTTGFKEIDYFISSKPVEVEDAQKDYTERLIKFKHIPSSFKRPEYNEIRNLNVLKHDGKKILIGIAHSLFKINISFDKVLEEISKAEENIEYVLFDTPSGLSRSIKERWARTAHTTLSKSKFYNRLGYADFLASLSELDIMLDPFNFGAGTIFWQCMSFGLPIVSMPTRYRRSRATLAGYKQMGINNPPIAKDEDDYIYLCRKLINSESERGRISREINMKSSQLYRSSEIKKEYEICIRKAIEMSQVGKKLPLDWSPNDSLQE